MSEVTHEEWLLSDFAKEQIRQYGHQTLNTLLKELTDLRQEVSANNDQIYMAGEWYCPKCSFRLHKRTLNPSTLAVGINNGELSI